MKTNYIFVFAALICIMSCLNPKYTSAQGLNDSIANYFTLSDYYDSYYDSLIQIRGSENMQGTGYKDYLRWKWFYTGRHGVDGDLDDMWESIAEYHANYQSPQGYPDEADWQFLGPLGIPLGHGGASRNGTGKGMMLSIWVSEGDHSLMYAGSHHSGLWKTTDGGENWYPLHDNDARIHGVNSIAVDWQDNNTIYITSGNSINSYSHYADGVFKSRDGGESWEQLIIDGMELPTGYWGARLRKILIHPNHSNRLYFTTYKNVFMSEDGGEQWTTIFDKAYFPWPDTDSTTFDKHNGMFDFEIDSMNDSLYYLAGSEIFMIKDSLNVFDTINLSEEIFHIGLQSGDSILNRPSRAAIDVDSHFPGIAWFSYIADYKKDGYDSSTFLRIVKFSSLDTTFELVFDKKSGGYSADKFVFEVGHIDASSVHFYIGGLGIGKIDPENYPDSILSIAAGAYPGPCWIHVDMRDMQLLSDGNGNDTLFLANDAGISWGTPFEHGQTGCGDGIWHWEYLGKSLNNGLDVTEFYGIGISDQQPDLIAGGCQDLNDMLLYNDEWINFGGGDGSEIVFDPDQPNIFYFSEWQSSALFRTNTYGEIYDTRGFYSMTESTMFMPIELDPNNSSILYSGGKDLLKFSNVNDFMHDVPYPTEIEHFNNNITDIEINYSSGSRKIYVSTDKVYYSWDNPAPPDSLHYMGSIYFSGDGGNTFIDKSDSMPGCLHGFISDIEVNPDDISEVWVACAVYSKNSIQEKKVFTSTNYGDSWDELSDGLPEGMPVFNIKYIPEYDFLLAATDVGIFRLNPPDTTWFPYSNNLPLKIITDLEVNTQSNAIVASTFGRGIWKTPLLCEYHETPWTIRDDLILDNDTILENSVIIADSATLTIRDCKIFMPSDAKIVVQRGSTLELDSCILTSACNDLWWGVEVWGNSHYSQATSVQGKVEMRNNATIEKARKAIFCGKNIENTYPDWSYTGGFIDAREAIFKNNRYGIQLWNYHYPEIMCNFQNCKFQTSRILEDGSSPEYFMTLVQVNGVKIEGCNFEYTIAGEPDYHNHGRGIYALDAGFVVKSDSSYNKSTFTDLDCGIFALNILENLDIQIYESKFTGNLTGIYASAVDNLQIYLNEFKLDYDSIPSGSQIFGGVYLDNCTGYLIEENTFGDIMHSMRSPSIGLTINNSGEAYNEIYKNTFYKLYIGTLAQNVNRNVKIPNYGLKLNCNVYDQNEYDIVVTGTQGCGECGISKIQGSSSIPAGNLFSKTGIHPTSDFDNQMDSVFYYHHRASLGGLNRWIPYYKDSVYLISTLIPWSETTCPSRLPSRTKEFSKNLYETSLSTSDSLQNLLQQLVDGGNTTLLEMEVTLAEPDDALDLHEELISFSPYLSDTILVKSVEKEDVLAPVMVKDILVANPQSAKSPKVMVALENRVNELPDYMMSEILLGKDSVGHKEILESDLSYWDLQEEISMNQLIHFYRMDTLAASHDSVLLLLENATSLQAHYRLMMAYFENDDTVSALSTFESIPDQFDLNLAQSETHQHWNDLVNTIVNLKRGDKNLYGLDSIQLATLSDLSLVEDLPGSISRNILHYLELAETGPYYILPENQLKSGYNNPDPLTDPVITQESFIKFYPNPAKNYIIVEYTLISNSGEGMLFIYSSNGKLQFSKSLDRSKHDCLINTRDWDQGIYFYNFVMQRDKDQNGKIIILK